MKFTALESPVRGGTNLKIKTPFGPTLAEASSGLLGLVGDPEAIRELVGDVGDDTPVIDA